MNREIEALKKAKGRKVSVRMEEARIFAIKNNLPAVFNIDEDTTAEGAPSPFRFHRIGVRAVAEYDEIIEFEARRAGIEPDFVRAVVYVENADGYRFGLDPLFQDLGMAKTLLPMNIDAAIWSGIGGVSGKDFDNPKSNIRAGVALIREIAKRVVDPTPAKIGSIWQFMGKEKVSDNGVKIERAMREKTWALLTESDVDVPDAAP